VLAGSEPHVVGKEAIKHMVAGTRPDSERMRDPLSRRAPCDPVRRELVIPQVTGTLLLLPRHVASLSSTAFMTPCRSLGSLDPAWRLASPTAPRA
jgi:hypothetical protein